ncbi:MAG: 7-cyano-7-deazaguanine synthase QueC [Alphaproteobacteria bacterium]
MKASSRKVIVLFSGGQDSSTCLAWALNEFPSVETVGFFYGQRHVAEIDARARVLSAMRSGFPRWAAKLGQDHVLSMDVLSEIGGSALTDDVKIEAAKSGLPTTFVPGRNLLFLTAAAALGMRRGARDLVGGMCETDYSGYPDCRNETIEAMSLAIELGFAEKFTIHTPLMKLDKAQTWELAETLGGQALVELIVEETVTCYEGDRVHHHDWGYGCGSCPACVLRERGYVRYRESVTA